MWFGFVMGLIAGDILLLVICIGCLVAYLCWVGLIVCLVF